MANALRSYKMFLIEMYFVRKVLPLIVKKKHNHIVVDSNNNEYYYSLNIDYDHNFCVTIYNHPNDENEENIVGLFIDLIPTFFDDTLKGEEACRVHYFPFILWKSIDEDVRGLEPKDEKFLKKVKT